MLGTTHAASGAAVWLAGCAAATTAGLARPSIATIGVGAAVTALGALLPDLDHPKSLASRSLWPLTAVASWGIRGLSRTVYHATSTDADDRRDCAGSHRGLTHTVPWAAFVGGLAVAAITVAGAMRWPWLTPWWWLGLALGLGCLVHTVGDWGTHHGVPLAWPFTSRGRRWRRFSSPLPFRTGGWVEHLIVGSAMVAVALGSLWLLFGNLAAGWPLETAGGR